MKLYKYAPACDLSPLKGAKCPYCHSDGTLCEFDDCPLEVAHESGDEQRIKELHEQILNEINEVDGTQ